MHPTNAVDDLLLEVRELTIQFPTPRGPIRPVDRVSLGLQSGRTLGIVGESGSGKSLALRATLGFVPPPGRVTAGFVRIGQTVVTDATQRDLRAMRGGIVSMIFQDPMASLNPVLTVGDQLTEVLRIKTGLGRAAAADRAAALFERVGIRPARARLRSYPHQFSGGMAQRVMIAIAIAAEPRLLLADEPTTALDVSVQEQVLALLDDLRSETQMAMVLVSHDIGVIARSCDDVAVMYAGRILEKGPVKNVLHAPRHPYTRMLLAAVPSLVPNRARTPLATIAGHLPDPTQVGTGCPFMARCPSARPDCATSEIGLSAALHASACLFESSAGAAK